MLVQRVPHYDDVSIASGVTLSASDWSENGGGVLIFRAEGDVTISGTLDASGAGFRGGDGVATAPAEIRASHMGLAAAGRST